MSLGRDLTTVGTATLLSRLLGFCRDVGIAALLGAGVLSDAYFAALQIPNLFRRLLAEGAINAAFVPMWLRVREERGAGGTRLFGESVLGAMLTVLGALALLCLVFTPTVVHLVAPGFTLDEPRFALAIEFTRLSIPYVALVGLVCVGAAVLNAEGHVAAAVYGIVVFNAVLLVTVAVVAVSGGRGMPWAGAAFALAIAIGGLAQLLLVGGAVLQLDVAPPRRPRWSHSPEVRRFFAKALPGVIAGGIPQLKFMAGAMVASSSQAGVSWLYYANRLYELPLGVASVAIASVMVPRIAASVRAGSDSEFAAMQSRAFEIACGVALPAAVGFAVLAELISGGLFERGAFGPRDTAAVAAALAAICAGLPGHVLEKVFGAVSFAHEDTRTPMFAALCGLATSVVGAILLFPTFGHVGVAAAIAVSGWVGAGTLGLVLLRRRWLRLDAQALYRLPRIVLATLAMGVITALVCHALPVAAHVGIGRIAALAALVLFGLGCYLGSLQVLGVARISTLLAATRARF
ncbi:MAG TPA: murein biosynthesis integral membrane protein MurJ [Pseudolabrys sp.]|nr:murein biosynthesis integral membrane protein MurJ [Pseudolabrys sp.]